MILQLIGIAIILFIGYWALIGVYIVYQIYKAIREAFWLQRAERQWLKEQAKQNK